MITRKAYGGAYDVMGSKHLARTSTSPGRPPQIAVMGAQGAVNLLYRAEMPRAADAEALRADLISEYDEHSRQSLRRGRARLRRCGHRSRTRPGRRSSARCGCCATSARSSTQEARQHPAMTSNDGDAEEARSGGPRRSFARGARRTGRRTGSQHDGLGNTSPGRGSVRVGLTGQVRAGCPPHGAGAWRASAWPR